MYCRLSYEHLITELMEINGQNNNEIIVNTQNETENVNQFNMK